MQKSLTCLDSSFVNQGIGIKKKFKRINEKTKKDQQKKQKGSSKKRIKQSCAFAGLLGFSASRPPDFLANESIAPVIGSSRAMINAMGAFLRFKQQHSNQVANISSAPMDR